MAQKFLDGTNIGAVIKHVGGTRMSKNMRGETVTQSRGIAVLPHNRPCPLPAQSPSTHIEENSVCIGSPSELLGAQRGPSRVVEPTRQRNSSPPTDRHDTFFRALSKEAQQSAIEINIAETKCADLGNASAGAVEHFEDGSITKIKRCIADDLLEQRSDFCFGQGFGETGGNARCLDRCGRIRGRQTFV
jgi:hypothetical protein